MGAKDSDFGRFSVQIQTLTHQLEMAELEAGNERKEKQAVISKLETCLAESQELSSQLKQAQGNFDNALKTISKAVERMETEKQLLNRQLEQADIEFTNALAAKSEELESTKTQLASESTMYQEQLQRVESAYRQRQDELLKQIDTLRNDAAKQQSELQDKVQIATAHNRCLEDQLQKIKVELKAKEKNFGIMATEKQLLEEI